MHKPNLHPGHDAHVLRARITRLEAIRDKPDAFSDADHAWATAHAHLLEHEHGAAPRPELTERFPPPRPVKAVPAPTEQPFMAIDFEHIRARWERRAGHHEDARKRHSK